MVECLDKHETIIIDDFRASNLKFNYLLKLLDRYPMRIETEVCYRQLYTYSLHGAESFLSS